MNHHARGAVHVRSAGIRTRGPGRPHRPRGPALRSAWTPSGEFPKPLTDDVVRAADVVVTMGCGDACPVYPGKRYLDWDLEDPEGKSLHRVRAIRDQVDERVQSLLADLGIRPVPRQTDSREDSS